MAKKTATTHASTPASARAELDAAGARLMKDDVAPHDIPVHLLTAPLAAFHTIIEAHPAEYDERGTGLLHLEAAVDIGDELKGKTARLPDDLRTLRKRPAEVAALQAQAGALLGALHQYVRRQARGRTMRSLADRFSRRSGNSITELLKDAKSFQLVAQDPEVAAAFNFLPSDLATLGALENKLAVVPAADVSRSGISDAQLAEIDLLQLSLEAFYSKLAGNFGIVLRDDPKARISAQQKIPRSQAGRGHSDSGGNDGTGAPGDGTGQGTSAAPQQPAPTISK